MRNSRTTQYFAAAIGLAALVAAARSGAVADSAPYRPRIVPAEFRARVTNPWFPLVPGTSLRYVETERRRTTDDVVTVTPDRKVVMGVSCTVVHDVATTNGRTVEETWEWYAQDRSGNVWYFGEATKEFRSNGSTTNAGSWQAGVDGARPGIIMYANPKPGAPYRQEYRAGAAEDMGQVDALGDTVAVPYGHFVGCVRTKEWSAIEEGSEHKWYAKGVGFVRSESTSHEVAELVSVTKP